MSDSTVSTGGISVFGMLGVLFVGLKLTGFISWSWWWVTAPFWMPITVAVIVAIAIIWLSSIK